MKQTQHVYKYIDFPPLTEEQRKELEYIDNMPESEIDTSDIPECTGDVSFYYIQPVKMPKTEIHVRIDNDNLAWLKELGRGYQKRLNAVIRWARQNNCPIAQL